ncbi:serine hydrolase domain-containing protein [Kitasatospora sp. NPDC088351]|uniref:serine hydrolase domain-containing protein n=1 Tax=Kitasatospora sp. NPDC088351 TaxID=3155180 RepID=UPI003438F32E
MAGALNSGANDRVDRADGVDVAGRGRQRRRSALAARAAVVVIAGAGLLGTLAPAAGAQGTSPYRPAAPGTGPAAAGPALRVDRSALDDAVRGMVKAGGASATLAAVREDYRITWQRAAGTADLATGAPATADGRFRIGSVTKTFVSTVILQLAAEHRIRLDDSVETILPGAVPNGSGITVRQLLNHTSGLFNYTEDASFDLSDPARLQAWLSGGRYTSYQPQQLVDLANTHPPYFAPGQGWHYSNTNYILAGMMIERVTGRSWADEVERRIIQPLGLTGTSMPINSPVIPGPHANGYYQVAGGPEDVTSLDPSMAGSAGAGISTTADLTTFISALLGGRLLGPAELREMKRTSAYGEGTTYGLGLQRKDGPCGEYWGHGGGIPGYSTMMLGEVHGQRQFAASINPYDVSNGPAANAAFDNLVATGMCGGRPPAAAAAAPSAAGLPESAGRIG